MKKPLKKANHIEIAENEAIEKERLRLIKKYENCPKSVGRTQALKYLNGVKLTPKQAVQAFCFDCMGGIRDCINSSCSFFRVSAYKDEDFVMDDERKDRIKRLIADYEANVKTSSGKTLYLKHLKGEELTYTEAMFARCAECTCGYADGRVDCKMSLCNIYPWMPYRKKA